MSKKIYIGRFDDSELEPLRENLREVRSRDDGFGEEAGIADVVKFLVEERLADIKAQSRRPSSSDTSSLGHDANMPRNGKEQAKYKAEKVRGDTTVEAEQRRLREKYSDR